MSIGFGSAGAKGIESMTSNIAIISIQTITSLAVNTKSSAIVTINSKCIIQELKIFMNVTAVTGNSIMPILVIDGVEVEAGQEVGSGGYAVFQQGISQEAGSGKTVFVLNAVIKCAASFAIKIKNCCDSTAETIAIGGGHVIYSV